MNMQEAAHIHGIPGERARLAGLAYALWPLLGTLFLAGLVLGLLLPLRPVPGVGAGFAMVTLALVLYVAMTVYPTRVSAFFKGARGEERVASVLAGLPAGYHVFHGLDGGGGLFMARSGDIDHVVVGPAGLFVIETKCWQGEITCGDGVIRLDGRLPRRDPVSQVRHSARRLAEWLAARLEHVPVVRPMVCFAGRGPADGRIALDEVMLCDDGDLLQILTAARSDALTVDEVAQVAGLIERLG